MESYFTVKIVLMVLLFKNIHIISHLSLTLLYKTEVQHNLMLNNFLITHLQKKYY